ncbi:MAG: hypothetical protein Ta2G_14490 [Termitinemataceae bacterium]|nr:MAG: hypothetical protein Ta2G_14490 [Termitinemataceae bacterium]
MKKILNPSVIFFTHTIPSVFIIVLYAAQYNVIKSIMSGETLSLWIRFAIGLIVLIVGNGVYASVMCYLKKGTQNKTSVFHACISLAAHIAFICLYMTHIDDILPDEIPNWIVPDRFLLYPFTFLMPAMVHCLLICVVHSSKTPKKFSPLVSFGIAVGVPVLGYVAYHVMLSLGSLHIVNEHFYIIAFIASLLVFLFFLLRAAILLFTSKSEKIKKYSLVYTILLTLILPITSLILNKHFQNVFGNFNSIWFYVLTVLNAIFLCLPNLQKNIYRLILFVLRSLTFAFSAYFFVVFLPFLPFSLALCIVAGSGFLILSPLLLGIIHTSILVQDTAYLKPIFKNHARAKIASIFCLSFIIIPALLSASFFKDKKTLIVALDYLYAPDYSKEYLVDTSSLKRTLETVRSNRDDSPQWLIDRSHTPFISSLYNRIVLDNLTLADSKLDMMQRVFFNNNRYSIAHNTPVLNSPDVKITKINVQTHFDKKENVYISMLDFELTAASLDIGTTMGFLQKEYSTLFDLPAGSWISDYYLYVSDTEGNERKEEGILAEKKSAMWVFNQNQMRNRDPGILYYTNGNTIAFKVFPFNSGEKRRSGIEFTHLEPITLYIDGNEIKLTQESGDKASDRSAAVTSSPLVAYISASEKKTLPRVQRKPYFHFLLDASSGRNSDSSNVIKKFLDKTDADPKAYPEIEIEDTKVSIVNTYTHTFNIKDDWESVFNDTPFDGGFFLDRAIKKSLYENFTNENNSYPIFIVITDRYDLSIMQNDYADIDFLFPETNETGGLFFVLTDKEILSYSFLDYQNANATIKESEFSSAANKSYVREYRFANSIVYVSDNDKPSIAINPIQSEEQFMVLTRRANALSLQYDWMNYRLHPHKGDKEWRRIVRRSFGSKLLSPFTSYIVVENDAQKAALIKKQGEVLDGKKVFDTENDAVRMSEPGLLVLLVLLSILLYHVRHRRRDAVTEVAKPLNPAHQVDK